MKLDAAISIEKCTGKHLDRNQRTEISGSILFA